MQGSTIADSWKLWEGRDVDGEFPLRQYLGGSDRSAVFLTERGGRETQRAAIKLVPAKAEDPEVQLSWWALAAKLSHPHLLRLFQWGRCRLDDAELLYVVTEFAEENLSQILPERPLTPAEARQMLNPVLDVLGYLHGKGFVHGRLKPTNIMAVKDQLKVSSDGLCGVGEANVSLTASLYTAPEIAAGAGITPSSDVWSLGATLLEALTQHPPVILGENDPVISDTLPAPFLEIARHCLRRTPQLRWTVAQIQEQMQPGAPARLVAATASADQGRWRYWAAGAAGLVLLAMFAGPKVLNRRQDVQPNPSTASEPAAAQSSPASGPDSGTQRQAASPAKSQKSEGEQRGAANNGVPGEVALQIMPDISHNARATIQGKIKVSIKVRADATGNVTGTRFVSRGPSRYFASKAQQAAQKWKFEPPQVNGHAAPSEWLLQFEFARSGTTVRPSQARP